MFVRLPLVQTLGKSNSSRARRESYISIVLSNCPKSGFAAALARCDLPIRMLGVSPAPRPSFFRAIERSRQTRSRCRNSARSNSICRPSAAFIVKYWEQPDNAETFSRLAALKSRRRSSGNRRSSEADSTDRKARRARARSRCR